MMDRKMEVHGEGVMDGILHLQLVGALHLFHPDDGQSLLADDGLSHLHGGEALSHLLAVVVLHPQYGDDDVLQSGHPHGGELQLGGCDLLFLTGAGLRPLLGVVVDHRLTGLLRLHEDAAVPPFGVLCGHDQDPVLLLEGSGHQ
jgi:hypothetical protein